tara:strand:- start:331 stop:699 length:369 start_codon:yes stop_codon:yes gene_type:complete
MTKQTVYTVYKGTTLSKYPHKDLEILKKTANDVILAGLKAGFSLQEQVEDYRSQLDIFEKCMNDCAKSYGGVMNDKAYKMWAILLGDSELYLGALWGTNVACLIKLKAIKDDDMNGFLVVTH